MKYLTRIKFNDFFFEKGFNEIDDEIMLTLRFLDLKDEYWSAYIDSSSLYCHGDYYTARIRFLADGHIPSNLLLDKSLFDLYYMKTPVGHGEILGEPENIEK